MVTVRRIVEEEISDDKLGDFLTDQARTLPVRGCAAEDGQPIRRGDLFLLREEEYKQQGIFPNSPVCVLSVVPEAGVFWGIYLRDADKSLGGSFFNGMQVAITKPERPPVRLATER